MRQPSLFESFNARSLEPEQVGRGFIFSRHFIEVASRTNTIVLGPRGSGKTTLLKMLTLPALLNWYPKEKSKEAVRLIDSLDYIAIYVPSDFTWYPDFRRPIKVRPPKEIDDLLSYGLFRNHVLLAMCDTLMHMTNNQLRSDRKLRRFSLSTDELKADSVAKLLADSWTTEPTIGGFYGLKQSVTRRIRQIQHLLTLTATKKSEVDELVERYPYLSAMFFDDLREFSDIFEHVYKTKTRWSACFDEVEIAPDPVKLPIWQSGRSFDPRYLIKLSASPYDSDLSKLSDPRMPLAGNDFREVDLTVQNRHDVLTFSQKVFASTCSEFKVDPKRAESLLGSSFYDDSFDPNEDNFEVNPSTSLGQSVGRAQRGRLAPTGFYNRKFQSLASKDQSFAAYMHRHSIDPEKMAKLPEFQKAALIRKILSTVAIRDEFLFERGEAAVRSRRFRARKRVPHIYTGALSIFTICEGNPRWLIGLVRPLVSDFAYSTDRIHLNSIARAAQAQRIERTITNFMILLSTLRTDDPAEKDVSIVELIELLGDFCFDQVLGMEFNPEPILSFVIDEDVNLNVLKAIGRAINQGALVLVPKRAGSSKEDSSLSAGPGSIRGRRVRLTFLLSPRYRLPLVLGRQIELSSVLRGRRKSGERQEQLILSDLFTEDA